MAIYTKHIQQYEDCQQGHIAKGDAVNGSLGKNLGKHASI